MHKIIKKIILNKVIRQSFMVKKNNWLHLNS